VLATWESASRSQTLLLLKAELHGKLPYLPRYDDMQNAFMNKELLRAKQLFYHVCFSKALKETW